MSAAGDKDLTLTSIAVDDDGSLHIGYHQPDVDVRGNGVITVHTMYVPMGDDYDDEIMVVLEALRHLVLDVLDDLPRLPPPIEADTED